MAKQQLLLPRIQDLGPETYHYTTFTVFFGTSRQLL
jgi:hypothetical protein